MKKLLLSILALGTTAAVNAQVYQANDTVAFSAWTFMDVDADGNNWMVADLTGAGTPFDAQAGCIISQSWIQAGALTPDNLAISPAIDCSSGSAYSLSWATGNPETTASGWHEEHYAVYVVTDLAAVMAGNYPAPAFETTLTDGETVLTESVDISAQAGGQATVYVVFRHFNCTDENWMFIDDVTVSASVGVEENTAEFVAFPNPAENVLNIKSTEQIYNVTVTSMEGKLVATSFGNVVDVAELSSGMYFYTVTTQTGNIYKDSFIKK